MTPAQYRAGGAALHIHYQLCETRFGQAVIANTHKGICYLAFAKNVGQALSGLQGAFPAATLIEEQDPRQKPAIQWLSSGEMPLAEIKLHLKGTSFQLKVWEALLRIPFAGLRTYGNLAREVGSPSAARAVGSAVGANPVAYLIPCHRVIRSSGVIGDYRWGSDRKVAMIGWEACTYNA